MTCGSCGRGFEAKRATAKFCSERCKKRAQRQGSRPSRDAKAVPAANEAVAPPREGPLLAAAISELSATGRMRTAGGVAALALANRIDQAGPLETGSAYAALVKEFRAALAAAMAGAEQAADPIDELRLRREQHAR